MIEADTGLASWPERANIKVCLSGQGSRSGPVISTFWQPVSCGLPRRAKKNYRRLTARTLLRYCSDALAGKRGARHGRRNFPLKSVAGLQRRLLAHDGGKIRLMTDVKGADHLVETQLRKYLLEIEKVMEADCLTYVGPIAFGADDFIRVAVERLKGGVKRRKSKLLFILETDGGFAEAARRISDTLRYHYTTVDFLVPSHAMSAGTILAMSGDSIWMDYYSVLGPIDPQITTQDQKKLIPALGYLIRYKELLDKANAGNIGAAELEILLNFDQGELYSFEQARDLSVSLLEEWLAKYKFKNWKVTQTSKTPVTRKMRKKRAKEIAEKLNDTRKWNSHGIGINMQLLRRDLNLRIDDFEKDAILNKNIRSYHRLLTDYMAKMRQASVVHTRAAYQVLMKG